MSAAKHTPGPWKRDGETGGVVGLRVADQSGSVIAYVKGEANARLIIAAPELLSLLEDAVEAFGPHMEAGDDEWLKFARAAIAKATGSAS